MADVRTHWSIWPCGLGSRRRIDTSCDIQVIDAGRWPTRIDRQAFAEITGLNTVPTELITSRTARCLLGQRKEWFRVRDKFSASRLAGGASGKCGWGTHQAMAEGPRQRSRLHDAKYGRGPQVFVTPPGHEHSHVDVPPPKRKDTGALRRSREFVKCFQDRSQLPAWEQPNLLAIFRDDQAVELAGRGPLSRSSNLGSCSRSTESFPKGRR